MAEDQQTIVHENESASGVAQDLAELQILNAQQQFDRQYPPLLTYDRMVDSENWKDITQIIAETAKGLKCGEMLHPSNFSLFDSMSALELMDPKMDSGMLTDDSVPVHSIEYRLQNNLIPLKFDNESCWDILATLNYLMQCEASWYNGSSPVQSLLTSLYLHDKTLNLLLKSWEIGEAQESLSSEHSLHLVLTVFCASLLKSVSLIRKDIRKADIYEEEDFYVGLSEAADVGCSMSNESLFLLFDKAAIELENLRSHNIVPKVVVSSFENRLNYRKAFLQGLLYIDELGTKGTEQAQECFREALLALQNLSEKNTEDQAGEALGVDKSIMRLLSSSAAPREVKLLDFTQTKELLLSILQDMVYVCAPGTPGHLEDLMKLLQHFSSRKPNVLPRSYMLLCNFADEKIFGPNGFRSWLKESMISQGVPSVLLSTEEGNRFIEYSVKPVYEILQMYLHYRSRHRSRIEFIIESWSALQNEAHSMDAQFSAFMEIPPSSYPRYLTAWTMEKLLVLMIHYITLGFELELYDESEYGYSLWYLDSLLSTRLQNLQITSSFVEKLAQQTQEQESKPTSAGNAKKSKRKKKSTKPIQEEPNELQLKYDLDMSMLQLYQTIGRGLFQYIAALDMENRLTKPEYLFGSMEIRFKHRFEPFRSLVFPPPLSYQNYVKTCDFSNYSPSTVYQSASDCLKLVRNHADQILASPMCSDFITKEVKSVLKLSIANAVGIARTMKACSNENAKVVIDFSIHQWLPLIQLKPREKQEK